MNAATRAAMEPATSTATEVTTMFLPLGDDVRTRSFPVAGIILVLANVLVFIYMLKLSVAGPGDEALTAFIHRWGLVPADLADGRFAGLFAHVFLHGGLIHLAGNLIVLWALIHTLEGALGTVCCVAFFLLWGVAGGLAHAVMHWGNDIPVVGASGAVAGLIGAYCIAFGPMTNIRTLVWIVWPMRVDIPAGVFAGVWVLLQLQGLATSPDEASGIAWYAHVGGFVAGYVTLLCVRNHTDRQLVRSRHGELVLEDVEPADATADPDPDLLPRQPPPDTCPYCGSALGEQSRMADRLARCGNPDCERMVYLDAVDESPEPVTGR
jgi:membrane associated rhomboid family serine protease